MQRDRTGIVWGIGKCFWASLDPSSRIGRQPNNSLKNLGFAILLASLVSLPGHASDAVGRRLQNQDSAAAPAKGDGALAADKEALEIAKFKTWLDGVRTEAKTRGISDAVIDSVLPNIKRPIRKIIKRDRNQPEVKQTYANYLSKRLSKWRINKGIDRFAEDRASLQAAEAKYGVQSRFIAAIWGVETNYGTVPLTISVFDAITTLAYDTRRAKRFRRELFAALEMLEKGYATLDQMKGSWAGAMGQPQFMPDSYLRYAVDMDGDGRRNIWTSLDDIHGSIGHYLQSWSWRSDQTWGRAVRLPKDGEKTLVGKQADGIKAPGVCGPFKSMGVWRDLQDWQKMGVRRTDGSDLPSRSGLPAALIVADEGDDQGYLVYQNFCAIMRYNPSFKYALSVGLLSDQIAAGHRRKIQQAAGR